MYSVYQHWDPLKICAVGKSYPPEFYSFVKNSETRNLLEKIAEKTEEDYQAIIKKLQSFNVEVLRPSCVTELPENRSTRMIPKPPMFPRDNLIMIGKTLYHTRNNNNHWGNFYQDVRDESWPKHTTSITELTAEQQQECIIKHNYLEDPFDKYPYSNIIDRVKAAGNQVKIAPNSNITGSMVWRIGKDLYIATTKYKEEAEDLKKIIGTEFGEYRTHIVETLGHSDGTFCPVTPGLIVSLYDIPTFENTFPGWEVLYLPDASWRSVPEWVKLKEKNQGRWWLENTKTKRHFIKFVDTIMSDWVGYVEETVFDVNMLVIDSKNVIVFNENDEVFAVLDRYGITPHVVPFTHRYFWDGGIHCITCDLHREGTMQNYFPNR